MKATGCSVIVSLLVVLHGWGQNDAQQAAEGLVRACDVYDEVAMRVCGDQLVGFGEPALAVVMPLLDHENANVRWQGTRVLGELQIICDGLEPKLAAACHDPDADVRAAAIGSLAKLYPRSVRPPSIAVELCEDPHRLVRANAWMARWQLARDRAAPGSLAALLASDDWMVSRAARDHLVAIGTAAVPALIDLIADGGSPGCVAAIQAAGSIDGLGTCRPSLVAMLERHATCNDEILAAAAAFALANVDRDTLGVLTRLSAHADSQVRARALSALAKTASLSADQIMPVFKLALADHSTPARIAAIAGIGKTGCCGDAEIIESLTMFLADPDPDIRGASIATLGNLAGENLSLAMSQLQILADGDPKEHLRTAARELLDAAPIWRQRK